MPKTLKGKLFLLYVIVSLAVSFVLVVNFIIIEKSLDEVISHTLILFPIFFVVLLIGLYFTNKFLSPIKDLSSQAEHLLSNPDKDIKVKSTAEEINTLACSLEDLRKKINKNFLNLKEKNIHLKIIENLNYDLLQSTSLKEHMDKINKITTIIMNGCCSSIILMDKRKKNILLRREYKLPENLKKLVEGICIEAIKTNKETIIINSCLNARNEIFNKVAEAGSESLAVIKFNLGQDLIVILNLFSKTTGRFTNEKVRLLKNVAKPATLAMVNAVLHRDQKYTRNFTENILKNLPIATVVLSYPKLKIFKANSLFKNLCKSKDIINLNIYKAFPGIKKTRIAEDIDKFVKNKKSKSYREIKFIDGSFWNINIIPVLDEKETQSLVVTLQECTGQVLMRRKLQKLLSVQQNHAEELETIISSLQNGLIITDERAKVVQWNKRSLEIFECQESEIRNLIHKKEKIFNTKNEKNEIMEDISPFKISKEPCIQEVFNIKTPKGNKKCISISGVALKGQKDNPRGGVFTVDDLTEIMKIQDKLKENLIKKKEWSEKLRILNKASLQISKTHDPKKILEIAGKTAKELTDSNLVSAHVFEDKKNDNEYYSYIPAIYPYACNIDKSSIKSHLNGRLYSRCLREGIPKIINDVLNYPEKIKPPKGHVPIRGLMAIPFLSPMGTVVGLLILSDKKEGKKYNVEDKNIVHSLAVHASVALTNAYNYQKERRISYLLQKSMLPILPNIHNLSFDYAFEAATSGAMVGGDFFDIIELEEGKTGIVIADVAGKGIEAASVTSTIKNTIRAFALEKLSPGDILTRTNKVLCNQGIGDFVTCVVGILDTNFGKFTYANAGHHPPVLYRNRLGSAIVLLKGSCPIGVMQDEFYEDFSAEINAMDTLLFYTDGLVEARREKELFGEERLLRCVLKYCHHERPVRHIVQEVELFSNNKFHDDIAVLSVRIASLVNVKDQLDLRLEKLFEN